MKKLFLLSLILILVVNLQAQDDRIPYTRQLTGVVNSPRNKAFMNEDIRKGNSLTDITFDLDVRVDVLEESPSGIDSAIFQLDSITYELKDGIVHALFFKDGDTIPPYFREDTRATGAVTINIQTGTSYTALFSDRNRSMIYMDNVGADTVFLPTVATSGWEVGDHLNVTMWGAGTTVIDPMATVNINDANTDVPITEQYGTISLFMRTTNEWHIIGTK